MTLWEKHRLPPAEKERLVTNRIKTAKPRVKSSSSQAEYRNRRWAMDMTHIPGITSA